MNEEYNFIVADFYDNDFHSILRSALIVVKEELYPSCPILLHKAIVEYMVAMSVIRDISDGESHYITDDVRKRKREYFDSMLTIRLEHKFAPDPNDWVGVYYDLNLNEVYYMG